MDECVRRSCERLHQILVAHGVGYSYWGISHG